jgi:hypothetical protein
MLFNESGVFDGETCATITATMAKTARVITGCNTTVFLIFEKFISDMNGYIYIMRINIFI